MNWRHRVILSLATLCAGPVAWADGMLDPDFGTGVVFAACGVFVRVVAGLPWWWVGVGVGGVAAVAPVAWFWLLRPYQ